MQIERTRANAVTNLEDLVKCLGAVQPEAKQCLEGCQEQIDIGWYGISIYIKIYIYIIIYFILYIIDYILCPIYYILYVGCFIL